MYAAGYGTSPLRSRRATHSFHPGRWPIVLVTMVTLGLALARVLPGAGAPVDAVVVVQPGDTLWAIAAARYPGDDVRARVDEIERLNRLQSPVIEVGQTLRIPAL